MKGQNAAESFGPEYTPTSTTLDSDTEGEQKKLLCDRCQKLDLTVDKFIIGAGSSIADTPNYTQHYQARKTEKQFRVKSGRNWNKFNTIKTLREYRKVCQLCDLIYRAIIRYGKNIKDTTSCSLSWEIHGREPRDDGNGFDNKNRRIRLSWNDNSRYRQEVFLMLVAPHDPRRPNSDAAAKYYKGNHFLGRGFKDDKEKQALIKSWIDLCVHGHERCRDNHDTDKAFRNLMEQSYFGVVDVTDMQLKSLPTRKNGSREPYVALSYVWGKTKQDEPPYTTNRRNVMTHILHGGLETPWEKLPRTIQDAMLITSRLGYRYLWIDSLCIVQDSKSSWQLNANAMHLVYGNARFTICAADGKDSLVGLRAVSSNLRTVRSATMSGHEGLDEIDPQPMSAECGHGVRLMVSRPLEAVINDSVWSQRAWTFQERIFSHRCLIFAEGRVYWQCRSIGISQDIHTDGNSKGLSLDPITSPLRTLQELQSRPLLSYMSFVGMYTGRSLTKRSDALAAFQGVSWLLERYMDTNFLFGLPVSHFDLVMLWGLSEVSKPRKPGQGTQMEQQTCTDDQFENCNPQAEHDSFRSEDFPTWAWAGWMGAKMNYQSGMLEGCLENVQEWLTFHTWIKWHIRDEKGHLQPLWDVASRISILPSDQISKSKEDNRWGGYNFTSPESATHPPRIREREKGLPPPEHEKGYFSKGGDRDRVREQIQIRRELEFHRAAVASARRRRRRSNAGHEIDEGWRTMPPRPSPSYNLATERNKLVSDSHEYERTTNKNYIEEKSRSQAVPYQTEPTIASNARGNDTAPVPMSGGTNFSPARRVPDEYGRFIPKNISQNNTNLEAILPDSPFGVLRRKVAHKKKSSSPCFMPILQFCTWRQELCVMARDDDAGNTSTTKTHSLGAGLRWCDIVDSEGDWCGSIILDETHIYKNDGHICTFIAMSDAKHFTQDECPVWTYYIPKEREESEWDLYYVLLLERNEERGLWERAGLGKVFKSAFRDNVWAEIKLG